MEKEIEKLEQLYADTLAKRTEQLARSFGLFEEVISETVDKQDLFKALAKRKGTYGGNLMTKQYKLLPCPFCGGEAEITPINDYVDFRKSVQIYCKTCRSSTNLVPADVTYCAEEEAVKAWNRRWDGVNKEKEKTK